MTNLRFRSGIEVELRFVLTCLSCGVDTVHTQINEGEFKCSQCPKTQQWGQS